MVAFSIIYPSTISEDPSGYGIGKGVGSGVGSGVDEGVTVAAAVGRTVTGTSSGVVGEQPHRVKINMKAIATIALIEIRFFINSPVPQIRREPPARISCK
jgi:hypothetical protein